VATKGPSRRATTAETTGPRKKYGNSATFYLLSVRYDTAMALKNV
jgi:hypothetical protein